MLYLNGAEFQKREAMFRHDITRRAIALKKTNSAHFNTSITALQEIAHKLTNRKHLSQNGYQALLQEFYITCLDFLIINGQSQNHLISQGYSIAYCEQCCATPDCIPTENTSTDIVAHLSSGDYQKGFAALGTLIGYSKSYDCSI